MVLPAGHAHHQKLRRSLWSFLHDHGVYRLLNSRKLFLTPIPHQLKMPINPFSVLLVLIVEALWPPLKNNINHYQRQIALQLHQEEVIIQRNCFYYTKLSTQIFFSSQQLLRNGLYRNIVKGKTMGRWIKDQKERRKHELRTQNAQLHAAVSVAGVAAAVAALAASSLTCPEASSAQHKAHSKTSAAIASAAALVASHCIEIAEDMGADNEQILTAVGSAINARTNGDIMTLTAGAATSLRGAATLRARLQKGAATISQPEEQIEEGKDSNYSTALNFVSKGGELLKRTRKGDLHWKQVSFNINSNWQVVAKMKSKHMAGTFTKKKKCVVSGVYCDIPAWPGREREDSNEQRAYFGIKTVDRIIEFECRNKGDKLLWVEGIQHMLDCRSHV